MKPRTIERNFDSDSDSDSDDWSPDDEGATVDCPHCGREIFDAPLCPHCDRYVEDHTARMPRRPLWFWAGLIACLYVAYKWVMLQC